MKGCRWTDGEIAALRHFYPLGRWPAIRKAMPNRTVAAIRCQAVTLEIRSLKNPRIKWLGSERHLLRKLYPHTPWPAMLAALPRHSRSAITKHANYLGLKRDGAKKQSRHIIIRELRRLRRARGIKQSALAGTIGSHAVQLAKWERGEQLPRLLGFFDWVNALGLQIRLERA